MKFPPASLALLLSTSLYHVHAVDEPCIKSSFTFLAGKCTFEKILQRFELTKNTLVPSCSHSASDELKLLLGLSKDETDDNFRAKVMETCHGAFDGASQAPWSQIVGGDKNGQFEQLYFNGGTFWNEEVQTNEEGGTTNILAHDVASVKNFYNSELAQRQRVVWPDYLTNFEPETCELNAAYCCWPQDRQANDNNGNCATPYDYNCFDRDPADNTDVCYVDLTRSPKSNRFGTNGSIVFPYDEGAVHCHGFAWANDETERISRYKGNNLFFVSMYDHLSQRGYARNIPGAPMCACAEQMPSVSRSDCTQLDVRERIELDYNSERKSLTAVIGLIKIDFNACQGKYSKNNDLWYYFLRLQDEGKVTPDQRHKLRKYLVGDNNCPEVQAYEMEKRNMIRGFNHDETLWTRVSGRDSLLENSIGRNAFKDYFKKTNGIIRRVCATCIESHQDIYYKRLTPVDNLNLWWLLANSWTDVQNDFNLDFKLYSSLEDAENDTNAWEFCNFDGSKGFPAECGPTRYTPYQWSTFHWRNGRTDVAFYLQAPMQLSEGTGMDIGSSLVPGSTYEMDGKIYVMAAGWDIYDNKDSFRFAQVDEQTADDATLEVFVSRLMYCNPWSKACLMMRQTLDEGSPNVVCCFSGTEGTIGQHRAVLNGSTSHTIDSTRHSNIWLRLEKKGTAFTCSTSTDGQSWNQIHSVSLDWSTFYTGLAVSAKTIGDSIGAEATFENYSIDVTS